MADVFISYSEKDNEFANYIFNYLKGDNVKTFLAGNSLQPGQDWTEEIKQKLNQSDWVILLASKNSMDSKAVLQEVGGAFFQNKKIVPVIWDIRPEDLPDWIKKYQVLDLNDGLEKLNNTLSNIGKKIKSKAGMGFLIGTALVGGFLYMLNSTRNENDHIEYESHDEISEEY